MHSRFIKILAGVLLAVVSIVVVLAALEVGVRLFRPQKYFAVTVNTWDRDVGTVQIPGARGFVICPEYNMDLIINSKGLRDREFTYAKPRSTRRILCLGASFTCGYGVQADEAYPKVLERLLNSSGGSGETWEVINAGVGSTGTANQLAFFQHEGYKYDPDFVLLCFSQAADFWTTVNSGLYSLEKGRLVKHAAPQTGARRIQALAKWIPGYATVFARSHLLNFVKFRVARFHYRELAERVQSPRAEPAREELVRHLLISLRDVCADRGCRLVITVVPRPDTWDLDGETEKLIEYAKAQGIPYVDLTSAFRTAAVRGLESIYPMDQHWTKDGHRLAANELSGFFVTRSPGKER
jgi:hypothetical protein